VRKGGEGGKGASVTTRSSAGGPVRYFRKRVTRESARNKGDHKRPGGGKATDNGKTEVESLTLKKLTEGFPRKKN